MIVVKQRKKEYGRNLAILSCLGEKELVMVIIENDQNNQNTIFRLTGKPLVIDVVLSLQSERSIGLLLPHYYYLNTIINMLNQGVNLLLR